MKFSKTEQKRTGIVLITVGVTAALCVIFFLVFGSKLLFKPGMEIEPNQNVPSAGPVDSISIPGFEKLTIPTKKTGVSVNFYNPEGNACYFEISIILTDTKEELYKSKLVQPGQKLYRIELNRGLDKGTYQATLHYGTYSLTDQTPMNGANVPFILVVE
ncbi:MAG: hypothetical protein LBJ12_06470 [Oscillospiraceae bacterium]|jgi:hypothetical protein|nr:hypothetical protein [Oscillospiraceae bacterium]